MKETRDIIVTVLGFSFSLTDTELMLQILVLVLTAIYLTGKIIRGEKNR